MSALACSHEEKNKAIHPRISFLALKIHFEFDNVMPLSTMKQAGH